MSENATVLGDFFVWDTLNRRDWAIALLTPEQRAASPGGFMLESDPQTVALTEEECQAARRRFDRQVVELMKMRGSGRDVPPPNAYGLRPVLAWRGHAITEEAAQAAWDRFHASEATP